MRPNTTFLAVLLVMAGACCLGQQPSPNPQPTALTIVISTAWASEHYMADYRALARQAVLSLHPGDYLEIVTARTENPRLELAQTMKTGSAEEIKSIEAVLARIQSQFLSNPSLPSALEVVFERLKQTCSRAGITSATTIILSDGKMSPDEADRFLAIADKCGERGWSVYLTGTRDTNKDVLVAANKHRLTWSLISEAAPAIWLTRKTAEPPAAKAKDEHTPEPPGPAQPITPPPATAQASQEKPLEHIIGPGPVQAPPGPGYRVTTQIDSIVSLPPGVHVPANKIAESTEEPVLEANEPAKPPAAPAVQPAQAAATKPSWWARIKGSVGSYGWLVPTLAVLAGLILLISKSMAPACKWDGKIKATRMMEVHSDPGVLVATFNGHSYPLGPPGGFRSADIGKAAGNTVRLADDSLEDQHARIFSKRTGYWIKNTARSPVTVNGSAVKPGGKCRLVLPSRIELNDKTRLNIDLQRQKPASSTAGSDANETAK